MDMNSGGNLSGREKMDKVGLAEENRLLRGKLEGYKSLDIMLRKKVEEVKSLKAQLAQHEQLHIQGGNVVLNSSPKSEQVDNSSIEIQHSSIPSQQLHTRSEESSAYSLLLEFPFQTRPTSSSPEAKKIQTYPTIPGSSTPGGTSNQHKQTVVSKQRELSHGDYDIGHANPAVLDSSDQLFSNNIDSLGPQIIAMANKVRFLEKKLKATVMEKDVLSHRLDEVLATKVREEPQIMEPSNSRGPLNASCPYCDRTNVKDLETSESCVGVDEHVTESEHELISFDRPIRVENTGLNQVKNDRKRGSCKEGNVNSGENTEDECNQLKVKYQKQEKELRRIIDSYRERLEHEKASKESVTRQLQTEKEKREQLKKFVKHLESRLSTCRSINTDETRIQYDENVFRENQYRDKQTCDDKVVPDLLMEISVLHQQMVVVVEDFEKERSDRARAMSARDTLKKNFDSLTEKVKVLKRQLVTAHANLTEQISRNGSLDAEISRLRSVIREKNQRKIQSAPVASRRTHNIGRPDIATEFLSCWQTPTTNGILETETTALQGVWSCDACTYANPAQRTVCEICGTVNRLNGSASSAITGAAYNGYHGYLRPMERTCRLVSRGLSTDETVTGHLDDGIDLVDMVDSYRSHSM